MDTKRAWVAVVGAALISSCTGFDATIPEGFAEFDDWFEARGVSAEGVVFRVRSEKNEPKADLAFWREALKKRMLDAGYALMSESEVKAGEEPGYFLELAAPVGQQDYTYGVALFIRGSKLVLVEAAGEVTRYAQHRQAILAAIAKLH
ncbi:MAG: hypothetical protein HYZ27_05755 [Deltaproteobacteria bacterium]|nr:hypothetical protein [Deltaproteobacteria bacterium]